MRVMEVSMERRQNEGVGRREIPEKTRRPTSSSGTIPTCENPMEQRESAWVGRTGDPREKPPANGNVRHISHIRKSMDPAGSRIRIVLLGRQDEFVESAKNVII
ncbi:hypothetical protein PR048_024730 [Dryococelus australis]|uniref:Uncharacterized protein n=1 Tax=Dryococelus australis TaxID=614101 RepID=A0ABQ9GPF6_9NEOP|nr:hypothetical protein PR048_024730 [Dryococelus australis]